MSDENLTSHTLLDIGVAAQIGRYSDAVQVSANQRWLFTSGTPGPSDRWLVARRHHWPGRACVEAHPSDAGTVKNDNR